MQIVCICQCGQGFREFPGTGFTTSLSRNFRAAAGKQSGNPHHGRARGTGVVVAVQQHQSQSAQYQKQRAECQTDALPGAVAPAGILIGNLVGRVHRVVDFRVVDFSDPNTQTRSICVRIENVFRRCSCHNRVAPETDIVFQILTVQFRTDDRVAPRANILLASLCCPQAA